MNSVSLLGVRFDSGTEEEYLKKLEIFLKNQGKTSIIVTPGPEFLMRARRNPDFKKLLNKSDLSLPDGKGVVLFSGGKIAQRVTGVDMTEKLLKKLDRGTSVAVILSSQGLSTKKGVEEACQRRNRGIQVVVGDENNAEKLLKETRCTVVFVATGSPHQEEWMFTHQKDFPEVRIMMGVGGTFDFLTGKQKRAPKIWRNLGIEWLWRLLHDPKRLPRIINAVILFPYALLKEHFFRKKL